MCRGWSRTGSRHVAACGTCRTPRLPNILGDAVSHLCLRGASSRSRFWAIGGHGRSFRTWEWYSIGSRSRDRDRRC